ncbi:hypothetical protein PPL_03865 [Heterostelium album PN500]|uniref:DUF4282 domain-containing protein n=1 Tax=Heterostelium pallidum (strain ATCC 26659 / Pp 5 / PN500) TaxID=670386 RepID=D3B5C9_HETP5|nr:hypothetical protein PPL_03865 [Heterostelium album PN500]EFA83077.1 hypothetical protein PPL_03865 [Heterostelium album PN500]|eukprot:XP_020435194.1 hypothetical protein PPL_03865 [Heterostelium album PN500]
MNSGKYVGLGPRDTSESPFPDTYLNWRELIYFRSWQAAGLIPFFYYFCLILAVFFFLSEIIIFTIASGAGGFFLGLLYGTLQLLATIFAARIGCEVLLSIFDIRDNIYKSSVNSSAPISHHQPTSSFPSSSSSSDYNAQQNKYQEPYNSGAPYQNNL